jgi:hypothetical protein
MNMTTSKKIRLWLAAMVFAASTGGVLVTTALPQTVNAACSQRLLTFPAWYKGLTTDRCDIKSPKDAGGLSVFIWTIALNIIDMALQAVGYISVGFIIRGGFKYMTAIGEPAEVAKAKKIIMDAVIGLVIAVFSVAFVNFVSGAIK